MRQKWQSASSPMAIAPKLIKGIDFEDLTTLHAQSQEGRRSAKGGAYLPLFQGKCSSKV